MTPPLRVTVLITTHNYGQFIEQAIDSVISQDFPQECVEIIVIDDGSTDDTAERVRKYGSRVRYFYQVNGGQAAALNAGFLNARGEIVALLDADDFFLPGKLAGVTEAFASDPTLGMVYHRLQEWHVETGERRETDFVRLSGDVRTVPDFFLLYTPMATSSVAYRRASLKPLLPIPENIRMLADGYLALLIPFLSPVVAITEFLAVYRIHGTNSYYGDDRRMPTELKKSRLQKWQILMDAISKWFADNGHTRKQLPVRCFLDKWALYDKEIQFQINPPGRLRFFSYLIQQNHAFKTLQTWKLTLLNYLCAPAALLVGYKEAHRFYKWRGGALATAERAYRAFLGRRSAGGSDGTEETDSGPRP